MGDDGHNGLPSTVAGHRAEGPAVAHRSFERRIDALPELVAFTGAFFERHRLDRELLIAVDFAIEELFTNMVKYGAAGAGPVEIRLASIPDGIEVRLIDRESAAFDLTLAPDADVTLPAERRSPGGLGLHLTRRLVDAIEYEYSPQRRESRIMFRKTCKPARPAAAGGTQR